MLVGPELADRLEVTVRTVRRDIEQLRELGYAIDAVPGPGGGYRLGAGGRHVPPLMLDSDEAVALAVCLAAAVGDSIEVRAIADRCLVAATSASTSAGTSVPRGGISSADG